VPTIGENDVLVKIHYAALNHLDLFVLRGWPGLRLPLPHIMGSDGAGIIEAVGPGVTGLAPGDCVALNPGIGCNECPTCRAGRQNFCDRFSILGEQIDGTFAEYVAVPATNALRLPPDYPLDLAAAAPLVTLTAYRLLVTQARLEAGETLLVQGAGGGVSSAAIQIAKSMGAAVIATTGGPEKVAKAQALGADHVIDYRATPEYAGHVYKNLTHKRGVDVALDSVGQATFETSLRLLRPGGRLVTCGATTGGEVPLNLSLVFWKQLQITGSTMSNAAEFRAAMSLVWQGKVRPIVDRIFALAEARAAEDYLSRADQFGKVVVQIQG
jgi:NADPH:quinone reductase-like Zn-dependent oxidoreductase